MATDPGAGKGHMCLIDDALLLLERLLSHLVEEIFNVVVISIIIQLQ